jgi:hypothetical protein
VTRQTYALRALSESGMCLVCGGPATERTDATVADHVQVAGATVPLCDAHRKQDRTRFVGATITGVFAKLTPLIVAMLVGRMLDVPFWPAIGTTLAAAASAFAVERALRPSLRPLCIITARDADEAEIDIVGTPPKELKPGGPATRTGNPLVDRTSGRLGLAGLLAAIALIVTGWQWTQSRPAVWIDNPTDRQATVSIDGEAHAVEARETLELPVRIGRHAVVITTQSQQMELPLEVSWGAPMLLATEPACYGIGQQLASTMHARGQLFTLGSGEWRRVACSE